MIQRSRSYFLYVLYYDTEAIDQRVRTDSGGKFEEELQHRLDRRSITYAHSPPDTPQYHKVAERALGHLREKAVAPVEELDYVINVLQETFWAQAIIFACDVTNETSTTLTEGAESPSELCFAQRLQLLVMFYRLKQWYTQNRAFVNIRLRQKKKSSRSSGFPATFSPVRVACYS